MILLADGGSTKTDWCLVNNGKKEVQVFTKGTNPFFQTEDEIANEIEANLMPHLKGYTIEAVYFYGAGCAFHDKNQIISSSIARHIDAPIEVGSDLLAAARSLCGDKPGIACIMGTGSNSCFYDGKQIKENISPLGFILGDEGSGAVLGKTLVSDCLKNQLPQHIKEQFIKQYNLTQAEILDKVYKQPFPNRFLASLSPFLIQHINEPAIRQLVLKSFTSFLSRNVMQYDYKNNPVHLVGSVAFHYKDLLLEAAKPLNIQIGTILVSPMEGLILYHQASKTL